MAAPTDETDEKPLDPAVERVRRKLLRFVAVNLGLLFVAVMAVVGAIVYKWEPGGGESGAAAAFPVPAGDEPLAGEIPLPAGARLLSHSLSGGRITLHVEHGDAGSILVYDIGEARIVGRFALADE